MNILPKKRWHVRTKENIARIRRDEAKHADEEKARQERIKLAEREARRELLLVKSRERLTNQNEYIPLNANETSKAGTEGHINFFKEVEEGTAELKQSNKDHDIEQKEEREKYERQIGYLTYLGQETNEALGKKSWYDVAPVRESCKTSELGLKSKLREDPLELIKKCTSAGKLIENTKKQNKKLSLYVSLLDKHNSSQCKKRNCDSSSSSSSAYMHDRQRHDKIKNKKQKLKRPKLKNRHNCSSEGSASEDGHYEKIEKRKHLEVLRLQRTRREKEERRRAEELLDTLRGNKTQAQEESFKPKYNSQFNPDLAKQNYYRNR
ncbi:hypothetical protein NQ315_001375 [Exocentrus adspersus]|uniref:CBF1-interacting co-repressor CIR N-terminal domain-containing protein n=1 Tax=Exocentrus adspersus TaxID=1586481 RepID=A0AAV8WF88_9CUCU|nr:hypothetical protein NQ315_001375 [Exocentrus adspersus]